MQKYAAATLIVIISALITAVSVLIDETDRTGAIAKLYGN